MPTTEKKKEEEKETTLGFIIPTDRLIATPSFISDSGICTATGCSLPAPSSSFSTSPTMFSAGPLFQQDKELNQTLADASNEDAKDNHLIDYISKDLYSIIKTAAQHGISSACIITAFSELFTDLLRTQHYSEKQIYWINQLFRCAALIELGASPVLTLSIPLLNYLLSEYAGVKKEHASLSTTGLAIGANLLAAPEKVLESSLAMITAIGANILGNKVTKYAYNLTKNSLFAVKNTKEIKTIEEESTKKPYFQ